MIVIAFTGYAGAGKDTACDYLVRRHGFEKTSFAAPLKKVAQQIFDFSDTQLYGPSSEREKPDERYPFSGVCPSCGTRCLEGARAWQCVQCNVNWPSHVTPRMALQTLGTEWGRRLNHDLWAKAWLRHIQARPDTKWCVNDLRFENELTAVYSVGGLTFRLLRGEKKFNHPSENAIATLVVDGVIRNDGPIGALYDTIDAMLFTPDKHAK